MSICLSLVWFPVYLSHFSGVFSSKFDQTDLFVQLWVGDFWHDNVIKKLIFQKMVIITVELFVRLNVFFITNYCIQRINLFIIKKVVIDNCTKHCSSLFRLFLY